MNFDWILNLAVVAVMVTVYVFLIRRRGAKNPSDVRTVFYFAFLSYVVSCALITYCLANNSIDRTPTAHDLLGRFVLWAFEAFLDFIGDMLFILAIIVVAIVPQCLTYLVCAPFGLSSSVFFVDWVLPALFWTIIKFLSVTSGITMAVCGFKFQPAAFGEGGQQIDVHLPPY